MIKMGLSVLDLQELFQGAPSPNKFGSMWEMEVNNFSLTVNATCYDEPV